MAPGRSDGIRSATLGAALVGRRGLGEARALRVLRRVGLVSLDPRDSAAALRAIAAHGQVGAIPTIAALRYGDRTALIDESGSLTFTELADRAGALAAALFARGVDESAVVGVLCANHRGFLDITFAAARLGARLVYLSPGARAEELDTIARQERVSLLVHDIEYADRLADLEPTHGRLLAGPGVDSPSTQVTLETLIATGAEAAPAPEPAQHSPVVLMTRGAGGTARGVRRPATWGLTPLGEMLAEVPFRVGECTYLTTELSRGDGYFQMLVALTLGRALLLDRRRDAERMLETIATHRPSALVLDPATLETLLDRVERRLNLHDLSSLSIVLSCGAAVGPDLVRRTQASIGRVLYNLYGTTEVAFVSFAGPADLGAAPGCVGSPPFGTVLALLDADGARLRGPEAVGRIFVENALTCSGYSDGTSPERVGTLTATGDLGHRDAAGRLWLDGPVESAPPRPS